MKKRLKTINVFPLAMTVLWSITFGISMHDWVIGICMGICFGIAFGLFGSDKDDDKKRRGGEIMKKNAFKWLNLAALLMFCVATFQIADGRWIIGAVCFACAVVFMSKAGADKRREKQENALEAEGKQAEDQSV